MNVNRRFFTFGLGSLATAPCAASAAVLKPAVTASFAAHVKTAQIIARAHNQCSRSFLMRHLKIDAAMAGQLEQVLLQRGIITLPAANGVAKAVHPIQPKLPQAFDVSNLPNTMRQRAHKHLKQRLPAGKSDQPENGQDQADDAIPTSHTDT